MSKNKKNFFVGLIGCGIIFFIGVLYLVLPSYYGVEELANIEANNLFISFILVYSSVNICLFYLLGNNPTQDTIWLCISGCLVGMLNVVLDYIIDQATALKISILTLTILISIVKIFNVRHYMKKKDATYYIEGLLLIIFFVVGFVVSICMFDDTVIQTIELGFFIVILSMISSISMTAKTLLKAPRFLGKIKF